jgi:hypothetical protein
VARERDTFWLEAGALVATLVGGAVLRYWLSTVVPFDAGEVAILKDATDPERAMRVPFIMMNGVSLFLIYVLVRSSAGVGPAFAAELVLQGSLTLQLEALRVRVASPAILIGLLLLAYFRLGRPATRLPVRAQRALLGVALLFALRQVHLLVTLPGRLPEIRQETAADVAALAASVAACGGEELDVDRLRACAVAWPTTRSVAEQEALWEHQRRLGKDARAVASAAELPLDAAPGSVALLDRRGAGFIVVPEGPLADTARRVMRADGRSCARAPARLGPPRCAETGSGARGSGVSSRRSRLPAAPATRARDALEARGGRGASRYGLPVPGGLFVHHVT